MTHLEADILIVGAGGAGMYAAIAAARAGAERVLLADKSLIGRGGATIMAQMTVAAALAEECPDDWQTHLADTLEWIRALRPKHAILTHMDSSMDYRTLCAELPAGVEPGYDGLEVTAGALA